MIEFLFPELLQGVGKVKLPVKKITSISSDDIEKILFHPIGGYPYYLKKIKREMSPLENVSGLMYINGDYYSYHSQTGF